jgi:peptidoglycan/LPS O-acetylase OafA/YrhL
MERISYLDGIRGIAIILVLICHSSGTIGITNMEILNIIGNGHLGVMIFFSLSGYLITKLLLFERDKYGKINLWKFYQRRALRIFPVFYLYLFILILCVYIFKWFVVEAIDFSLASIYLTNYASLIMGRNSLSPDYWYIGHLWTLSLEEQFYILWPTILVCFNFNWLLKILPWLLFLFPIIRVVSYLIFPNQRGQLGMMLHTFGDAIFWGCYMALLERYESVKVKKVMDVFLNRKIIPISLLIFIFIISPNLKYYLKGAYDLSVGFTLEGISIGLLLLHIIQNKPRFANFLNGKVISWIGVLSYSLYVWQQLFLGSAFKGITSIFPINIGLIVLTAYISYTFVEKPILKLKKWIQ